ncbi:O-antigen ligase [Tateyamaria sp. Alg231-49]|uniref:O-antigen ligase family protein n=1 Tax=Tateyamaria sp. Alg231-49 TaxID=1922219 RepID=UPI000D554A50|nr:O-antigen ligase family protein [Tateyamaria sp. Alg231-49]
MKLNPDTHKFSQTQNIASRAGPILLVMAMMGAFRSIGHIPIFLGYIAAVAGLVWLALSLQISRFLLPSYFLVIWGYLSLAYNELGPGSYVQLTVLLGGVGLAELVSRINPNEIADFTSRRLVWIILLIIVMETVLIQLGMGQRVRSIDANLTGGLLPDLGIQIPRYMGTMGGSGYSGALAGALAFFCWIEGRKRAAITLFIVTLLMVSRGPLIALLFAALFQIVHRRALFQKLALLITVISVLFPVLIWWLKSVLTAQQILFLIDVSTSRFLHYISFLNFGLENPVFGVGYGNWRETYTDYFWVSDFQRWGEKRNSDLIREAHNFMLDIFGEMGIVAWILAGTQMLMTSYRAMTGDARYGSVFLFLVICFLFLSGLSNWTYWVFTGVVMAHHRRSQPQKPKGNN